MLLMLEYSSYFYREKAGDSADGSQLTQAFPNFGVIQRLQTTRSVTPQKLLATPKELILWLSWSLSGRM